MKDPKDILKEKQIEIPKGLAPEEIKKKLDDMDEAERLKRAAGEDVPLWEKQKPSFWVRNKRFLYPAAAAACVFIIFSLGMAAGRRGERNAASDVAMTDEAFEMASVETADEEPADVLQSDDKRVEEMDESAGEEASREKSFDKTTGETDYESAYAYFEKLKEERMQLQLAINEMDMGRTEEAEDISAEAEESAAVSSAKQAGAANESALAANVGAAAGSAEEEFFTDTNERTEGVQQGDIVKTDGKYIYVYEEQTEHIRIYKAEKGETSEVGGLPVSPNLVRGTEMYVSGDWLVLVGDDHGFNDAPGEYQTQIYVYDISEPENADFAYQLTQDGEYVSSRLTEGYLYTFSSKAPQLEQLDKKRPMTYVPEAGNRLLYSDELCIEQDCHVDRYMLVTSMALGEEDFTDRAGILAGSQTLYVSDSDIYMADRVYNWEQFYYGEDTRIVRLSYREGEIQKEATGRVPGFLLNDYCLDEQNGDLRLVVTYTDEGGRFNALYVLDKELKRVGVIKKLAEGETIRSARFMGDTAYFVTFRQTDPLFAVDLSKRDDPRIIGYLKIPGFSAYLHPLGDDLLLGVGYATSENGWEESLKLSVFDISDPADIRELDTEVIEEYRQASVLKDSRAFMYAPDDDSFGFAISDLNYEDGFMPEDAYLVYRYEKGSGFELKLFHEIEGAYGSGAMMDTRGVVIGDYLYVVTAGSGITSFDRKEYNVYQKNRGQNWEY